MNDIDKDFFDFIEQYSQHDSNRLRLSLKKNNYPFDLDKAINQIDYRKKYKNKLSYFLKNPKFLFPDSISGEQASHQGVATFHSSLIPKKSSILDMTAGLGIDSLTFAKQGHKVTALDIDETKVETLKWNAKIMKLENIRVLNQDSIQFLKETESKYDIIFIDPARRDKELKRVYKITDCNPNIIENYDFILNQANKIIIKASPMLDLTQTIKDFPELTSLKAVGLNGECKEMLIEIDKYEAPYSKNKILIEAVNLNNKGEIISSFKDYIDINENGVKKEINYANVDDIKYGYYLLEPSAMVMKLSPWVVICNNYNALKLGKSSHLFISDKKPSDFPGRVTFIHKIVKKQDRKSLVGFPASVISRNYPLSPEEIRKKYKLKEGDKNFLYATSVDNKPILILTGSETITG